MKLEINYKKKTGKSTNMWRLNNMLLNNKWVKEDIKREIKKYFETNENGNTTYQHLCDAAKAVLRRKLIVIKVLLRNKKDLKQPNFRLQGTTKRRKS